MKVIVVGGGVIGVTTAYYLARAGVQVVLLDEKPDLALGASFANAGSMTASRAGPWASPRTLTKTLKGYLSDDSAFRLGLSVDPALWRWLFGFTLAAFSTSSGAKRQAMIELGMTSAREREQLDADLALEYGPISSGLLTLYNNSNDFDLARKDMKTLRNLGIDVQSLNSGECQTAEPTVAWDRVKVSGGILALSDTTADCRKFTLALAQKAVTMGVQVQYGVRVKSVRPKHEGMCQIVTADEVLQADAVVVAAGINSRPLINQLGLHLPMYPVKGYSVTVPTPEGPKPKLTISDEAKKVFVSPFSEGLRAAGIADITGYDLGIDSKRIDVVKRTLSTLYPSVSINDDSSVWAGLRAMTHDGPPLIFGVQNSGIWINSGHGSLGWTFACGAAAMISRLVTTDQAEPENPFFGLSKR